MRRTSRVPLPAGALLCALWMSAAVVCVAQIQPQDRILQPIDESQMTSLRGNVHPMARAQFDRGRLNPSMAMAGVSLTFKLSASQQAALDRLLSEQRDPASPNYHKWLTTEQYAARFGMSQGDLDRVTSWLQSQGFTDIQIARSRTRVSFAGTVARVEAAFRTELHDYEVNGETHFANATEPALPAAFAGTVLAVQHLNNFSPKPRAHGNKISPRFTSSQTGNHFLTPADFATIYDLKPLYDAGIDGTGVTIVVIGQTSINVSDVNTFRQLSGLSSNPPQILQTPGTGASASCSTDLDEAAVDIEWAGGVAKGASILYDYSGVGTGCTGGTCSCTNRNSNAFDALQDAIENNRGEVVSLSYGNCEANLGTANVQSLQQLAQLANSQGQTITAASGDSGAADCEGATSTSATTGLAVDVPASIPEVTGVGGTEFTGDSSGVVTGTPPNTNAGADAPYWAGTTGSADDLSSAMAYIPEMAWNDTAAAGNLAATGGGVSTVFAKPTWQAALTPADAHRDVPDVSLNGSPAHDSYLICSQGWCNSGSFRNPNSTPTANLLDAIGGTSVGSQVFAGIVAMLDQGTEPNRLGNVNPTLYSLAASTASKSAFHDIVSGDNMVPCTSGTPNCPSGTTQIGHTAGTGYDLVTGLGSLDVNVLATAWPGFAVASSYSVSGSAATVASPGGSGSSTITVSSTSGFTGTVTLSCALNPPSSTAEVSCAFTAPTAGATTSVALSASNPTVTATMNVSTTTAHATRTTPARMQGRGGERWIAATGLLTVGIFLVGVPSRRRWLGLSGLALCVFLAAGMGCGGGTSSSANSQSNPGTPAGNYVVTVTGTSGNISHSGNVNVTVQ